MRPVLPPARAHVDDPDRDALGAERGGQRLVVAEAVLDRERDPVRGEDPRRLLGGPGRAGSLRRHDRHVDRRLAIPQRGPRAVDAHELAPAREDVRHVLADRPHAEDRDAHQPAFCVRLRWSETSSLPFIVRQSSMRRRAARAVFACTLKPPNCATRCGVRPTWPITATPLSTRARTVSTTSWPPSSFTASIPASLRKRAALRSASCGPAWYVPNGMSPTRSGRVAPRETAAAWRTMSSIVTGTVVG